jgi:hypothetical protein
MLRADRNMAILAGLICSAAGIKNKAGKVFAAAEFDVYNQPDKPPQKELTADDFMRVLSRNK